MADVYEKHKDDDGRLIVNYDEKQMQLVFILEDDKGSEEMSRGSMEMYDEIMTALRVSYRLDTGAPVTVQELCELGYLSYGESVCNSNGIIIYDPQTNSFDKYIINGKTKNIEKVEQLSADDLEKIEKFKEDHNMGKDEPNIVTMKDIELPLDEQNLVSVEFIYDPERKDIYAVKNYKWKHATIQSERIYLTKNEKLFLSALKDTRRANVKRIMDEKIEKGGVVVNYKKAPVNVTWSRENYSFVTNPITKGRGKPGSSRKKSSQTSTSTEEDKKIIYIGYDEKDYKFVVIDPISKIVIATDLDFNGINVVINKMRTHYGNASLATLIANGSITVAKQFEKPVIIAEGETYHECHFDIKNGFQKKFLSAEETARIRNGGKPIPVVVVDEGSLQQLKFKYDAKRQALVVTPYYMHSGVVTAGDPITDGVALQTIISKFRSINGGKTFKELCNEGKVIVDGALVTAKDGIDVLLGSVPYRFTYNDGAIEMKVLNDKEAEAFNATLDEDDKKGKKKKETGKVHRFRISKRLIAIVAVATIAVLYHTGIIGGGDKKGDEGTLDANKTNNEQGVGGLETTFNTDINKILFANPEKAGQTSSETDIVEGISEAIEVGTSYPSEGISEAIEKVSGSAGDGGSYDAIPIDVHFGDYDFDNIYIDIDQEYILRKFNEIKDVCKSGVACDLSAYADGPDMLPMQAMSNKRNQAIANRKDVELADAFVKLVLEGDQTFMGDIVGSFENMGLDSKNTILEAALAAVRKVGPSYNYSVGDHIYVYSDVIQIFTDIQKDVQTQIVGSNVKSA